MFVSVAFVYVLLGLVAPSRPCRPSHLTTAFSSVPLSALGIAVISKPTFPKFFKLLTNPLSASGKAALLPVNIGKTLGKPTRKASVRSNVCKMHLTAEPFFKRIIASNI